WHISLSSWLRDYLYVPLGGNRQGVRKEYRNLIITMLLGGLWHGARWTFVAWGAYHGLVLCIFRALRIQDVRREENPLRWLWRVVAMFHLTCAGWLLFRAESFAVVVRAARLMVTDFHLTTWAMTAFALMVFYCAVLWIVELLLDGERRLRWLMDARW